jgi:hypothetical protein
MRGGRHKRSTHTAAFTQTQTRSIKHSKASQNGAKGGVYGVWVGGAEGREGQSGVGTVLCTSITLHVQGGLHIRWRRTQTEVRVSGREVGGDWGGGAAQRG